MLVFQASCRRVEIVEGVPDFSVPTGVGPYKRREPGESGPGPAWQESQVGIGKRRRV
jgi:hypothetical protein